MSAGAVILRLVMTCLLSGVIGFERGFRGRAAGLRTHMLVGIGACLTVMTGVYAQDRLGVGDPFRIAAQVMSGIGFLGAGTILVRGKTLVTGLTTAAGLWTTAAIGIAVGVGFYEAALIS
ncbi:MAG: MgtC/SapB family protein, partial [Clostridia bacterium]|nr:MgtC/SapB family protein [Clostridia bacterium]